MSGATIGGVIGAAVGFYFGNPQLGWMIGSAIGGAIDPDVYKGPRLQDAQTQTSIEGVPRPIIYGTAACAGNVIMHGPLIEREKEDDGKGGPVQITYAYYMTYAIRICEAAPLGGECLLKRVWRDDKLVYSTVASDGIDADSAAFASKLTFYSGSETQLPDPSLEALPALHGGGVGNVPSHRGTCYAVLTNDDVTEGRGRIPQYRWEIVTHGTQTEEGGEGSGCGAVMSHSGGETFPAEIEIDLGSCVGRVDLHVFPGGIPDKFQLIFDGEVVIDTGYIGLASQQDELDAELYMRGVPLEDIVQGVHIPEGEPANPPFTGPCNGPGTEGCEQGYSFFYKETATPTATLRVWAPLDATGWEAYVSCPDTTDLPQGWSQVPDSPGWVTDPNGVLYQNCEAAPIIRVESDFVVLRDILEDICDRVHVTSNQVDFYDQTQLVRGFILGRQMPAGEAVRCLQRGYFFDTPEWDLKLRGVNRGGPVLWQITDDDLVLSDDDEDIRSQSVEFPVKLHLTTPNPDAGYEPGTQTAERESSDVRAVGEIAMELPIMFTPDENAQRADIMLKVAWEEAQGRWNRELPEEFTGLCPSNPFTHDSKRWRAVKTETLDGTIRVEGVRDRASAYTSIATGSTGVDPTAPVSSLRGPTIFAAMNLPALRTQHNVPGIYVAARGVLRGWIGAALQLSVDGGLSYHFMLPMLRAATIGFLVQDSAVDALTDQAGDQLTDQSGNALYAQAGDLVVQLYGNDSLTSVTSGQLDLGANAYAITTDDVSEVSQFGTATEEDGLWTLSDTRLGLLGTSPASHNAGDVFVVLDNDIYFLPLDESLIGVPLKFRPVSYGTVPENNTVYDFIFDPV